MTNLKELRRRMIRAMGGKCVNCGERNIAKLILAHVGIAPLGYGSKQRWKDILQWSRTGVVPNYLRVKCVRCHKQEHGVKGRRYKD